MFSMTTGIITDYFYKQRQQVLVSDINALFTVTCVLKIQAYILRIQTLWSVELGRLVSW
jgi:hypothetical protein